MCCPEGIQSLEAGLWPFPFFLLFQLLKTLFAWYDRQGVEWIVSDYKGKGDSKGKRWGPGPALLKASPRLCGLGCLEPVRISASSFFLINESQPLNQGSIHRNKALAPLSTTVSILVSHPSYHEFESQHSLKNIRGNLLIFLRLINGVA